MVRVIFTDYLSYRARLRGFDLSAIEDVVRFSDERYFDTATQRMVAVGRAGDLLVLVPYDHDEVEETMTPVTVHPTTRQQITFRARTGRFRP
jgi:hypothetical protein